MKFGSGRKPRTEEEALQRHWLSLELLGMGHNLEPDQSMY